MTKFYLDKKQNGKFYYYKVKPVSGKRLKELENSGTHLFDSYREALNEAVSLRKGN
jgi:hypothetical protein